MTGGRAVETFIVRIYRKESGTCETVAGVVEDVESEKTQGFRTKDELWRLLIPDGPADKSRGGGRKVPAPNREPD